MSADFLRREWPLPLALAAVLFAVYLQTMPPGAAFEDSALFAGVCYLGGIAHPPGYPLHTILCWPFAHLADFLPISPAKGAAIFSAICAAFAAAIFFALARRLTGCAAAAFAAAAAWGFGAQFWSQAIIPEVYSLNALLVFATIFALTSRLGNSRAIFAAAFLAGLGVANHWPLYLLNVPAFLLFIPRERFALLRNPKIFAAAAGLFLLGTAPYLYLYWRDPPFSLMGEVENWRRFLWYVSREAYADRIVVADWTDKFAVAAYAARLLFWEHAIVGAILSAVGAIIWRRRDLRIFIAILWGTLATSVVLAFILKIPNEPLSRAIFSVYPLPAMGFLMLFAAAALREIFRHLQMPTRIIAAAGFAFVVAFANYSQNDRSGDDLAEKYARAVLDLTPDNSRLAVGGDWVFVFQYLQNVLHYRPQVSLISEDDAFGDDPESAAEKVRNEGRLFLVKIGGVPPNFGRRSLGIVEETLPGFPQNHWRIEIPPRALEFARDMAIRRNLENNGWNRFFVRTEIFRWAGDLAYFSHHQADSFTPEFAALRALIQATPEGRLGEFIARATGQGAPYNRSELLRTAAEMESLMAESPDEFPDEWRAQVSHLAATALFAGGDEESALQEFRRAVEFYPSADNFAAVDLLQLLATRGEWEEYRRLRRRIKNLDAPRALNSYDAQCARHFSKPCE